MNRLGLAVLTAAVFTLFGSAHAQSAEDLNGMWKRLKTSKSKASYYTFESRDDGVTATHMSPPKGMTCKVTLTLRGDALNGIARWEEEGYDPIETKWEFKLEDGKLKGRTEWVSWDDDGKETRGWENHTFERAERIGLVTEGEAEEPFGDPIEDLDALAGGWHGPGGGWAIKADGDKLILKPVGHHTGVSITLANERGTLKGKATLPGDVTSDVEIGLDEGKLVGRSSWVAGADLGDKAERGWGPLVFERLDRLEVGPESVSDEPPPQSDGSPVGVWKRDDGLYVRIREEGGQTVGVLSDAKGGTKCRLRFELEKGVWVGLANWGGYETRWELSVTPEGLVGRGEWVDAYEGKIIARGWSGRTFTKLERVH